METRDARSKAMSKKGLPKTERVEEPAVEKREKDRQVIRLSCGPHPDICKGNTRNLRKEFRFASKSSRYYTFTLISLYTHRSDFFPLDWNSINLFCNTDYLMQTGNSEEVKFVFG